MVNFILRRLIVSVFLLIGISFVSFMVIQLPPGDFASSYETYLVNQGGMSQDQAIEAADRMRERYGLNDPLVVQYFSWIKGIVTEGQFGFSFAYRKDVGELIAERLPRTLLLALMAHAISTFLGVGIGIVVAPRQYSVIDNVSALFAFVMTSVPRFWIALVIMYVLVFVFDQHHVTSFFSPEYAVAPVVYRQVAELSPAYLAGGVYCRIGRYCTQHARDAREPAGRAEPTVRDDGAVEGSDRKQDDQPPRGAECAASDYRLPGHGAAVHGAGRAGGGHRDEHTHHGAALLRFTS